MPIDIGDAVLTFLGDTTQLDAAFAKVEAQAPAAMGTATTAIEGTSTAAAGLGAELATVGTEAATVGAEVPAAMAPATAAIEGAAAAVSGLNVEMAVGQQGAVEMGTVMSLAGEQTRASMYEARGEIGLLGEATGITLPRHVRSFVAELPGVASLLTAAFSATAVFFLIDALIQGTEKLVSFVSDTFIYTDAMKKANEVTGEMNKELLQHGAALKSLKDDYALLGLSGIEKTTEQMALLREQIKETTAEMGQLKKPALGGDPAAQKDYAVDEAKIKEFQQQLTNLYKQGAQERRAEQEKEILQYLELEKSRADSVSELKLQENRELLADQGRLNRDGSLLDVQYHEELYQNALKFSQQQLQLAILAKDPTKIAKLNQEIENLERDHEAKMLKMAADITNGVMALTTNRLGIAAELLGTDFQDKFQIAEAAASKLGLVLSGSLKKSLDDSTLAYQKLKTGGVATAEELAKAWLRVLQTQLAYDRAIGDSEAIKKDTAAINAQTLAISKMDGETGKALKLKPNWDKFFSDLTHGALKTGDAMKMLGQLTADGIGASVEAAVSGSQSFGQAMEQMLKSALAALAAHAVVKALEEIAYAFSDLANPFMSWHAGFHFAAAAKWGALGAVAGVAGAAVPGGSGSSSGSSGGSSSGGGSSTIGTASQPSQNPVQTVNAQHFNAGGLISTPTLSVVGHGPEAVIPLSDHRAVDTIADAIADRINVHGGGSGTHNWYIEGVISSDNLHKVAKRISRDIGNGKVRFNSSNSRRVTKFG